MRWIPIVLMLSTCGPVEADEKPIRLPMTPGIVPAPGPVAGAVDTLRPDTLYVVTADIPLIILQSPDGGLVTVTAVASPMNFFAKFADGTGKFESRTYEDKHIYVLSPEKAGTCELLLIPQGVESAEQIVRQKLTVSGLGPQPPPDPDPDPGPDPGPNPKPESFRVIWIRESGATLPAAQTAIPSAKVIRDYLNAKATKDDGQPGWREYDPDQTTVNEPVVFQELWKAIKAKQWNVPCVAIEVNGKVTVLPFPSDTADALATLKRYGGE